MAIYSYQDLEIYREGFALAIEIHRISALFPSEERFGLVDQIRRSSRSVCANIAEGFGRSEDEFRRYLRVAHGSIQETKVWIEFAGALGYVPEEQAAVLWESWDTLGKRTYRLSQSWQKR